MNQFLSEYSKIRDTHLTAQRIRKQEAFNNIPELKAAYKKLVDAQIQSGLSSAQNQPLDDSPIELAKQNINKILIKNNLPIDYLELTYDCALCEDYGFIGSKPCKCYNQRLFEERTTQSNLTKLKTENYSTFDINVFPEENGQRDQMLKIYEYSKGFCKDFPNTKSLLIKGETGLGKSFLLNCIGDYILKRGYYVRKLTAGEFNELVLINILKNHDYSELHSLQKCDLLILDDLGSEPIIKGMNENYFFALFNERIMAQRPSVIATNLEPQQLISRYNERTTSRLLNPSTTKLFKVDGKDLRIQKN